MDTLFSPEWLIPQAVNPVPLTQRYEAFHWLRALDTPMALSLAFPPPPRTPRELFIVHFFSGRRRQGDLQSALEAMPWRAATLTHVLSLDVIFGERADLSTPEARRLWLGQHDLEIFGVSLQGPPVNHGVGPEMSNRKTSGSDPYDPMRCHGGFLQHPSGNLSSSSRRTF